MTNMDLRGLALRTYDEPYTFDFAPYRHQLELAQLFREENSFVAVNDSPTGGGKTSSWLVPVLEQQLDAVAVYPTNALVEDQYLGIEDAARTVDHDVEILKVTADSLSERRGKYGVGSNGEVIDQWVRERQRRTDQMLFLTNPDILVMMCRDLYAQSNRAFKQFDLAVVDEFHRAGLKEQNTLRYLLDELLERDNANLERAVFLSATPDERQEATFERAMSVPYFRITENNDGEQQEFLTELGSRFHPVMPPVELDVRTAPTFGTSDVLLEDDSQDTLDFCRGGRTVVMLDGVHEVERAFDYLDGELDCSVERIDGFYGENKREKLERFDVLVSNSAVEVGIDFEVDRILFAGHNRASFLQRLGRLRNDPEFRRARCYVPPTVARELATFDGQTISRERLGDELESLYPEPREPETFDWRYSASEAIDHLEYRLKNTTSSNHDEISNEAAERIHRHFLEEFGMRFGDIKQIASIIDWEILRNLQWYRGDSVQALVWDEQEEVLRTYRLFYLLRHCDVEFHERVMFERMVNDEVVDEIDRKARYVDGFCTYHGSIETDDEGYGRRVGFTGGTLAAWIQGTKDRGRKPAVKDGLQVTVDSEDLKPVRNDSVDVLNQRLQNRSERMGNPDKDDGGFLCFPVSGTTKEVKNNYNLGSFFFLYPIALPGGETYSLAVGTEALYLHCHVQERQEDDLLGGI